MNRREKYARAIALTALNLLAGSGIAHAQILDAPMVRRLATPTRDSAQASRFGSMVPPLLAPRWMTLPDEIVAVLRPAESVFEPLPMHTAPPPSSVVSFNNNAAADYFRSRPVNAWDWVGIGVGTASLGLAAVFFQLGGSSVPSYLPRFSGVNVAEDPIFISVGAYNLRYDALGTLTLQAGMSALSTNLLRLLFAPSDRRTVRYMRTFVTEVQGGWLFGLQTAM